MINYFRYCRIFRASLNFYSRSFLKLGGRHIIMEVSFTWVKSWFLFLFSNGCNSYISNLVINRLILLIEILLCLIFIFGSIKVLISRKYGRLNLLHVYRCCHLQWHCLIWSNTSKSFGIEACAWIIKLLFSWMFILDKHHPFDLMVWFLILLQDFFYSFSSFFETLNMLQSFIEHVHVQTKIGSVRVSHSFSA